MNDELGKNARRELARRELARRNYRFYLEYVHGEMFKRTKMSDYLATEVQKFLEEENNSSYSILLLETPPQHGKSMTISETLPSWYMGKHPENGVILASYDMDFAEKFCRRNKEKIRSKGGLLFGVSIGTVDRSTEFELDGHRGRFISRGIMSGITGNPANLVIIDDPIKNRQEADSPTYRDRLWEEWQSSIKSRLAAGGKVIVIMTPWHEDDFAGRLLKTETNLRLIRLPVEAEDNDPLGREKGAPLCPELGKGEEWLSVFKASYLNDPLGGRRAWQALYQCTPRTEEGGLILRKWWKRYSRSQLPKMAATVISVDAAFKDGDSNDFVAIEVWGKSGNDYFLLYCLNRRLNFPATLETIRNVQEIYPEARPILIEDAANGTAVIQMLQMCGRSRHASERPDEVGDRASRKEMFIIPVIPKGGKVSRANAVSPMIESGHVYVPDEMDAPWVEEFLEQFTQFPNCSHDDMVDAATQALSRLLYTNGDIENAPDSEELGARRDVFEVY